jgi:hypothetical protein
MATNQGEKQRRAMRIYLAAAIALTILAAFGTKQLFFRAPPVTADPHVATGSMNILQMHIEHPSMDKLEVKEPF